LPYSKTPATLAGVFVYMTERKISSALTKIQACREQGYSLEALMRIYLLNVELVRFLLLTVAPHADMKDKKIKAIVKLLLAELAMHPEMKSIIQKKSLKAIQPWLAKMDLYFRHLKMGQHTSPNPLILESEKVLGLLKISFNKVLGRRSTATAI
jgi:hypothetical protein